MSEDAISNIEGFILKLRSLEAQTRTWAKSLSPEDYKAVATYLYWVHDELSVPQIAEMIGFKPAAKVNELVDKRYPFPVTCEFCGQTKHVHYNSRKRSKMGQMDKQRLELLKGADWQQRRAAYINGTFLQNFTINDFYEFDVFVRYRFAAPNDGVCDECRERITKEFEDINRLRDNTIARYKTMPYKEYLQTDHWRQLREHMLNNAGHRCQLCNRDGRFSGITLNVHHRTYENLGNESVRDVVVLCQPCHKTFHDNGKVAS